MQNLLKRELECFGYDPFGMITFGRSWEAGSEYRYGFNGMEGDNEIVGNDNALDFGARVYDARLGRWFCVDPMANEYAFESPYSFALNTPIQAIDPDGKLVVFVNGFRFGAYVRYVIGKGGPGLEPWNHNGREKIFKYDRYDYWYGNKSGTNERSNSSGDRIDYKFKNRFQDFNAVYVDGMYKPKSSAQDRYDRGVSDAKALIEKIESGEVILAEGETIKVVGHSHGGWHGKGMADYLSLNGYTVEGYYALRSHQPNETVKRLDGVPDYFSAQYSIKSDQVSSDQSELPADFAIGDSHFARMQDTDEMASLPDMQNEPRGGHYVQTTGNIFDIKSGQDGYVRPDGYCPKDGDCE